jgi:rhodanese-related sulfurtransferase
VKDLTVEDLARWRREGKDFVLLDVREPFEITMASLPQSTIIPMREIPARFAELPSDKPIAVLCHHGGRSERVAQFLTARGFADVANIDGGIDAYARLIDTTIPRY